MRPIVHRIDDDAVGGRCRPKIALGDVVEAHVLRPVHVVPTDVGIGAISHDDQHFVVAGVTVGPTLGERRIVGQHMPSPHDALFDIGVAAGSHGVYRCLQDRLIVAQ